MKALRYAVKNNIKTIYLFIIFISSYIVLGIFVEGFGKLEHFAYLLQLASFLGIVSAGQNLAILTSGIDLSVGSSISMGAVFFTLILEKTGMNVVFAILLTVLLGIVLGLINGLGISILRIPALVMTLATTNIYKGAALVITNGTSSFMKQPAFESFINDRWFFGFSGVVFTWVIVSIVIIFVLRKTVFGRKSYYIGANPTAAVYSGINPNKIRIMVYTLCGVFSVITGMLLAGFTGKSYFGMGDIYQFTSIAAVVVGGTSIMGGKGSYIGTIAGTLLITMIQNVLILFKISFGGQVAVQGFIILLLVIIYGIDLHKKKKKSVRGEA